MATLKLGLIAAVVNELDDGYESSFLNGIQFNMFETILQDVSDAPQRPRLQKCATTSRFSDHLWYSTLSDYPRII